MRVCLRLLADRRSHPTRPRRSQERRRKALETVAVSTCGWFLLLSFRERAATLPPRSLSAEWGQLEGAARVPAARGWPSRMHPGLSSAALCWPRGEARGRCGSKPGAALGAGHCGLRSILETGDPRGGAHTGGSACGAGEHCGRAAAGSESSVSASAMEGEAVGPPAEGGLAQRW